MDKLQQQISIHNVLVRKKKCNLSYQLYGTSVPTSLNNLPVMNWLEIVERGLFSRQKRQFETYIQWYSIHVIKWKDRSLHLTVIIIYKMTHHRDILVLNLRLLDRIVRWKKAFNMPIGLDACLWHVLCGPRQWLTPTQHQRIIPLHVTRSDSTSSVSVIWSLHSV